MPNGYYPALDVQTPNIAGNFLAGVGAAQDMKSAQMRNQLAQQQAQQQQVIFDQQQQGFQREDQFRNLLGEYLGQSTVNALGATQPQGPIPNQLYQLDPERAARFQAEQQGQLQERAKTAVIGAQYIVKSRDPLTTLKIGFPDMVAQLQQQGVNVDDLDDNQVRSLAEGVIAQMGPMAGIGPAGGGEQFTLGQGQTRFDANGNPIATVAAAESDKDPNDKVFQRANVLRDEFNAITKDFQTVDASYGNIIATSRVPSAAGDISLITSYMKMLDPASTVREGEFANAENAGGVPSKVRAVANKLINGERLSVEQRQDFVRQAANLRGERVKQYDKTAERYSGLATRAGIDPVDVVGQISREEAPQSAPQNAPTATNPATGETVFWNGTAWVPGG